MAWPWADRRALLLFHADSLAEHGAGGRTATIFQAGH